MRRAIGAFVVLAAASGVANSAQAQSTNDPFPEPITSTAEVIRVGLADFASLPDVDGEAARMMHMIDEPSTGRLFVSDMRGLLYSVSYDGRTVTEYLDMRAPAWQLALHTSNFETGIQSFTFHPQFSAEGTPGYGKLYTWADSENTVPTADFTPAGGDDSHDTVLLEWTATDPSAARYDGGAPRELFRVQQPFVNHNGGQIGFNPTVGPGDRDFGTLYVGVADGGAGGDPLNLSQDLSSAFGKIFRINPLGSNAPNGRYGVPADNPFATDGGAQTLAEIYAFGVRNPQRFAWDPETGVLYLADIGQNVVEEVSVVTSGANLGWNVWEGSFRFVEREGVDVRDPRSDETVTYPVVEYDQADPLFSPRSAATGMHVYRSRDIPQLTGLVLFGDNPSGDVFAFDPTEASGGGQDHIRRLVFTVEGSDVTLRQLVDESTDAQGKERASRTEMRFGSGPNGRFFLLNKHDGTIREVVR